MEKIEVKYCWLARFVDPLAYSHFYVDLSISSNVLHVSASVVKSC